MEGTVTITLETFAELISCREKLKLIKLILADRNYCDSDTILKIVAEKKEAP